MAKDTNELADEQNEVVAEKPQSVRESIISARDEVEEKVGNDDKVEPKQRAKPSDEDGEQPKAKRASRKEQSDADTDDEVLRTEKKDESTESSTEKVEDKPTERKATKAPVGWTKEAKAKWDDLPPEIQDSVLKREREVSDGFAGTKQAQERLSKYDAVIQPRLQQIQAFGATPEQTIDRLFQWMEVLAHPDENTRHQGFKTLADNFKINLGKFAPQQQTQGTTEQPTTETAIPSWAQSLTAKQQEIENTIVNQAREQAQREAIQRQESAKSYVDRWAEGKTHFDKVRAVMHGLITSGAVPPKANGELDLDTAYAKAIRMDDELWETVQSEKQEAQAAEKAKVDAKKRADAEKARKAGSSLRPSAPAATNGGSLNGSRSSTATTRNVSAAQSIRDAIKEVSER